MENGVCRWFVDISKWNPSNQEFSFLLSLLPLQDHSSITRFIKLEDRKRAIVSRLLQYAVVHEVLGIPFDEIIIKRTIEGKPYLNTHQNNLRFPNFNFNVSHDGDYVGITSEPLHIVGLDIVSHVIPKQETILEFIGNFSSHLTSLEWDNIINAGTCNEILAEFYKYWCVKEAYIKAIGVGLGYRLNRLEFQHINWTNISVYVDGKESSEWKFCLFELGKAHWRVSFWHDLWCVTRPLALVYPSLFNACDLKLGKLNEFYKMEGETASVARGHPGSAVEDFKRTLRLTELKEIDDSLRIGFTGSFMLRTVDQLLPDSFRASYGIYAD
ncbi:hypothetical protein GIB67_021485 [Kingdonia uniflora]|uniref:holo-[acyl-carrier-protein] synthase n=1 Tax=Kingdonia uniflora TaxID=39325 RepID=A0A7J7L9G0_9MAGN|nr:hypothetical protein GIB67_021485 [Kingdonia uniflora]